MLFSELYGAYYNAVAAILREAVNAPVSEERIHGIAKEYAFGESFMTIEKSLKNGDWPLLKEDRTAVVASAPRMPLTLLQKRWLKAVSLDPRVRLFGDMLPEFPDVEPLFYPEDVRVFDKYSDGDDYADEGYISRFRLILDAVKNGWPLRFVMTDRNERTIRVIAKPEYLEYSEKDDKFRVSVSGSRFIRTVNVGRIVSCDRAKEGVRIKEYDRKDQTDRVVLEVTDERNALERVLLHFAHFAKEAERIGEDRYRVTVEYDRGDETEMVIRILSFGPMVKVAAPDGFREMIKKRLLMQKNLKKSCE